MELKNTDRPGSETAKCRRCHRTFTPTKEGQEYGPKCAKKIAPYPNLEIKNLKGEVLAVII